MLAGYPTEIEPEVATILAALRLSVAEWVECGKLDALARWLSKELDSDGVPRTLAVDEWFEGLRVLHEGVVARPEGWPDEFDLRAEGWLRATLRFARPNGASSFSTGPISASRRKLFRSWADRVSDPGFFTVLDWWFPGSNLTRHAPPPLPADARPDRVLAILRANWAKDGDFLAVDHRKPGLTSKCELFGLGRSWLGPNWSTPSAGPAVTARAKPTFWLSTGSADMAEWSFRVGKATVTRTAILLRGRRLALLSEQWDGPGDPGRTTFDLAEGVQAAAIPDSRGFALSAPRSRSTARVYPIGLPSLPYPTERGSFSVEGRTLTLDQPGHERRLWRPLLVSWEPSRNRLPVSWRNLTVSEQSQACDPSTAAGVRVSWGRDETLLIYRSLAPAALRAVLGHQTKARVLIGVFTKEGEVEPIVKVGS